MFTFCFSDMKLKDIKIASFDLDHTIIKPKSGKKFPIDAEDWEWLYPYVPYKLKEIAKDFTIIIFSNQLGISKGKVTKNQIYTKCKDIYEKLEIPLIFMFSEKDDKYRKPRIGFWRTIVKEYNFKPQKLRSFYVGDGAGRLRDFNDTDRKFAHNIGIRFMTPEEYFLGKDEEYWEYNGYDLKKSIEATKIDITFEDKPIIILIRGMPCSGKTFLANKIKSEHDFTILSNDNLKKNFDKILKESILKNENIIVEGLYYSKAQQNSFFEIISDLNYYKVLINVETNEDLSFHLNYYRFLNEKGKFIQKIVYNVYKKYFHKIDESIFDKVFNYHPEINSKINKYFLY